MAQITVRANDDLVERVKSAADANERSMNEYVVTVLDAATDPGLSSSEAEEVRARLRRAGLLHSERDVDQPPEPPDPAAIHAARRAAAAGTPLSDIVVSER